MYTSSLKRPVLTCLSLLRSYCSMLFLTFLKQRVIMLYDKSSGHNMTTATVILADDDQAKVAVRDLNDAPLFDTRITVSFLTPKEMEQRPGSYKNLYWGWTASRDPDRKNANLRSPQLEYPKDIFRPIREGRRIAVDMPGDGSSRSVSRSLPVPYTLFHKLNVDAMSKGMCILVPQVLEPLEAPETVSPTIHIYRLPKMTIEVQTFVNCSKS